MCANVSFSATEGIFEDELKCSACSTGVYSQMYESVENTHVGLSVQDRDVHSLIHQPRIWREKYSFLAINCHYSKKIVLYKVMT